MDAGLKTYPAPLIVISLVFIASIPGDETSGAHSDRSAIISCAVATHDQSRCSISSNNPPSSHSKSPFHRAEKKSQYMLIASESMHVQATQHTWRNRITYAGAFISVNGVSNRDLTAMDITR